ncbi:MAG: UDP-N-acetylglucosamine 1-carboxyvinyltransferase [Christensenellales bacterium]
MEYFEISGGKKIFGSVELVGAKNSVLPLLAASLLTDDEVILRNCPFISDVDLMIELLRSLGRNCFRDGRSIISYGKIRDPYVSATYAEKMRASIFLLAPIIARCGRAVSAYPGGCKIGERKINLHIDNLKKMDVKIDEGDEYMICYAKKLKGTNIKLSYPSVGATEALIMAAVTAEGVTVIENVALEPEINDLISMLRLMGAEIEETAERRLQITGVERLSGVVFEPCPDRIVGGTLMTACAMLGGELEIRNFPDELSKSYSKLLRSETLKITEKYGIVKMEGLGMPVGLGEIETKPYPGFPTDLQAQIMALATVCDGKTIIKENVFENRFMTASQLKLMGAKIDVTGNCAIIDGVHNLNGTVVRASDLRGGAALTMAGAFARGKTRVYGTELIDRGYEKLDETFSALGIPVNRRSD